MPSAQRSFGPHSTCFAAQHEVPPWKLCAFLPSRQGRTTCWVGVRVNNDNRVRLQKCQHSFALSFFLCEHRPRQPFKTNKLYGAGWIQTMTIRHDAHHDIGRQRALSPIMFHAEASRLVLLASSITKFLCCLRTTECAQCRTRHLEQELGTFLWLP